MREIKFRVWDTKKIFYPDSLMFNEDGSVGCCFQHNNIPEGMANERGIIAHEGKCTLMQYTGLKDKNGKEIYDKDLVKICFVGRPDEKEEKWRYEVEAIYQVNIGLFETTMDMVKLIKPEMMVDHIHLGAEDYWWDGETFKIDSKYSNGEKSRSDGEIEVIGNIYETPELIK